MGWVAWAAGSIAVLTAGIYCLRTGRTQVVRAYVISCLVLVLMYATKLGSLFGGTTAMLPKMLLSILAPATLILALWSVKQDRDEVMGRPGDREAVTTAAIMYGAGSHAETGGGDMNGGMES